MKPQELADELKKLKAGESLDLAYTKPVNEVEVSRIGHQMTRMTGRTFTVQRVDDKTIRFTSEIWLRSET